MVALACPPRSAWKPCLASTNPAPAWTRALYELAESISPGHHAADLVRRLTSGPTASNEIIASGAAAAGLDTARARCTRRAAAMSLIENIQREDLNPLEACVQRWSKSSALTAPGRSRAC
jgi:hypothetical protein